MYEQTPKAEPRQSEAVNTELVERLAKEAEERAGMPETEEIQIPQDQIRAYLAKAMENMSKDPYFNAIEKNSDEYKEKVIARAKELYKEESGQRETPSGTEWGPHMG